MSRKSERCPWHEDRTASLKLMPYGWRCFGCGKKPTHEEVEEALRKQIDRVEEADYEKEDLKAKFDYILSLPRRELRGLSFHADQGGYYVCWDDGSYYKYRLYDGKSRYLSPKGHKPGLFWARRVQSATLWIVEGEINALSVAAAYPEDAVCSPGSASCFSSDTLSRYLTTFKAYSRLVVVLDDDAAGLKGLIEARAYLLYKVPFVYYTKISPDANEILIEGGREALRGVLQRADYR